MPSHGAPGPAATFAPSLSFNADIIQTATVTLYALAFALTRSSGLLGSLNSIAPF